MTTKKKSTPRSKKCADKTYRACEIVKSGKAIKFSPCGIVSHNKNDVENMYCAACDFFFRYDIPVGRTLYKHKAKK